MGVNNGNSIYNGVDLSAYATKQDLENAADQWSAGYTPKGTATVSEINALTGQQNGDVYILKDAGTVTPGNISVNAGDSVAWSSSISEWYPVNMYAPKNILEDQPESINLNNTLYWQNGAISSTSGGEYSDNERLRTVFLRLTPDSVFTKTMRTGVTAGNRFYAYDKDKNYLGSSTTTSISSLYSSYPTAYYFRISLTSISGATVDYTNLSNICTITGCYVFVNGVNSKISNLEEAIGDHIPELENFQGQELRRNYQLRDARFTKTLSGISPEDLPTSVTTVKPSNIRVCPVMAAIGGSNWVQGFCIASDGKVIGFSYTGNNIILNVGDLSGFKNNLFRKSVNVGFAAHCNFSWFSAVKYDVSDNYGLLYVGGRLGNEGEGAANVLVLRIVGDLNSAESCSIQLVQTITLPDTIPAVADVQNVGGVMYAVYGPDVYNIGSFPSHTDGDITLTSADIADHFVIDGTFYEPYQSGVASDGKLYVINGSQNTSRIHIIDVSNKTCKLIYLPLFGEYEGLAIFESSLYTISILRNYYGVAQENVLATLQITLE